ncbi:type II secretion system F family protein [Oerskovia flava]|uniref:type II secretion system F family protein n=1 Tax=Oerskovia flava TaxID=2986422 RepID=UPI00223F28A5|nr:type II secretion system F family protein [Oerskovia sp. JB1-3-2]
MSAEGATVWTLAACALLGALPWWAARATRERRLTRLGSREPDAARGGAPPGTGIEIGVLLELLGAAVRAGTSVPRALEAVGVAVDGPDGTALRRAGAALVLGASWATAWDGAPPRLAVVGRALRPAWEHGAAPGDALRTAGEQLRQERQAAARQAAARLAVHLVLPLGTCFLPAFVLIGLLPVLVSLGGGLLGR